MARARGLVTSERDLDTAVRLIIEYSPLPKGISKNDTPEMQEEPHKPALSVQDCNGSRRIRNQLSYAQLQALFIGKRGERKITNGDMAALLQRDKATISEAESSRSLHQWPRFFQSYRNITLYAGGTKDDAHALENVVFGVFYPDGLCTVHDLVECVAYRQDCSIEELGRILDIPHLNHKTNATQNAQLSPRDTLILRKHLQQELGKMQHVGIDAQPLLDILLPDPLTRAATHGNFSSLLNVWAKLAGGKNAAHLATVVAEVTGDRYAESSVSSWGKGIGLAEVLPHIINVFESNPATKDSFPAHKQAFIALAEQVLPRKATALSDALRQQPTLGAALSFLEKRRYHPLKPDALLGQMEKKTQADYAGWQKGEARQESDFPLQLTDALVQCLQKEAGTWITMAAREHLAHLAAQAMRMAEPTGRTAQTSLSTPARRSR